MEPRFNYTVPESDQWALSPEQETPVTGLKPVPDSPIKELRRIRETRASLDQDQFEAIIATREQGRSWGQIGKAMGMTRQGAYRWYVRRINPEPPRAAVVSAGRFGA